MKNFYSWLLEAVHKDAGTFTQEVEKLAQTCYDKQPECQDSYKKLQNAYRDPKQGQQGKQIIGKALTTIFSNSVNDIAKPCYEGKPECDNSIQRLKNILNNARQGVEGKSIVNQHLEKIEKLKAAAKPDFSDFETVRQTWKRMSYKHIVKAYLLQKDGSFDSISKYIAKYDLTLSDIEEIFEALSESASLNSLKGMNLLADLYLKIKANDLFSDDVRKLKEKIYQRITKGYNASIYSDKDFKAKLEKIDKDLGVNDVSDFDVGHDTLKGPGSDNKPKPKIADDSKSGEFKLEPSDKFDLDAHIADSPKKKVPEKLDITLRNGKRYIIPNDRVSSEDVETLMQNGDGEDIHSYVMIALESEGPASERIAKINDYILNLYKQKGYESILKKLPDDLLYRLYTIFMDYPVFDENVSHLYNIVWHINQREWLPGQKLDNDEIKKMENKYNKEKSATTANK